MRNIKRLILTAAALTFILLFIKAADANKPIDSKPVSFTGQEPANVEDKTVTAETPPPEQPKANDKTFAFPFSFTAKDIYGDEVTEASLGEKELFSVHYWATWCQPCVKEMPELSKVAEEYGGKVGFIALLDDYDSGISAAKRIAQSSNTPFVSVDAHNEDLRALLKMVQSGYVPTTILIDKNGNIVGEQIIGSYGSGYGKLIDEALK